MSPVTPTAGTARQERRSSLILFWSIVAGIFLFMLVAVLIEEARGPLMPAINKQHQGLVALIALLSFASLFFARRAFGKDMKKARAMQGTVSLKLSRHRSALIKYLVFCEVPVMLSIVVYLLTGNFVFQLFAAVFLGFMLIMMPSRKRLAQQLELDSEEQLELE